MHHYNTICQVVYAFAEVLSAGTQLAAYSHSTKQLTHMQTGKIHFAAGKCDSCAIAFIFLQAAVLLCQCDKQQNCQH